MGRSQRKKKAGLCSTQCVISVRPVLRTHCNFLPSVAFQHKQSPLQKSLRKHAAVCWTERCKSCSLPRNNVFLKNIYNTLYLLVCDLGGALSAVWRPPLDSANSVSSLQCVTSRSSEYGLSRVPDGRNGSQHVSSSGGKKTVEGLCASQTGRFSKSALVRLSGEHYTGPATGQWPRHLTPFALRCSHNSYMEPQRWINFIVTL